MSDRTLIRWSAEAVRDLEEIHDYIARIVPELGDPAVREIIHGVYRVVYELKNGWVEVLTIFRASRVLPLQRR